MELRSTRGHEQKGRGKAMRKFRMLVLPVVIVMIAAACTKKAEDNTDNGGETANKGTVNVLNALEPEENAVLQGIADDQINGKVDYEVTFEQSGDFEQQVQIRAEGGTLDVILLPQPGAVQAQAAGGKAVSLEDMGFDIGQLEDTFGSYFLSLGEYNGKHYGIPTNINLKSMVWYPKDDFDKAGYTVPTTWDEMIAPSALILSDSAIISSQVVGTV